MSYQQFQNPPVSGQSTVPTTTTQMQPGQYPVVAVPRPPMNPFAPKANATKKLGIALLTIGIITFLIGIILPIAAPYYWVSFSGNGIWCGIFIIITGSLCMAAASNPERYATRCAALTFAIITCCLAFAAGIIAYIGFIVLVSCNNYCYWDSYNQQTICNDDCLSDGYSAAVACSVVLALSMSVVFILSIVAAIFTGRGCCQGQNYATGGLIVHQAPPTGVYGTNNYQANIAQGAYPQQPYAASSYAPQPYSSYAPPPQQTTAPMLAQASGQASVTYGVDYNQQQQKEKQNIPESTFGEAPPPYNPN